jgi:serine/threonine-protein kinase
MIGSVISHYRILERLGGGGMGVVYKAQDIKLDRPVALKFLPPTLTDDQEARDRFILEARAASALQHPNVCVVYDIDESARGEMFIAMEYLGGATLKETLHGGPMKPEEAIEVAAQILTGLAAAHRQGILHRDIKPANVMVAAGGSVKIVDFGLAKLRSGAQLTSAGSTLGTAAYMAPEQVRGEDADHRSDLWSVGVILYEMLAGHLPFRGDHDAALGYSIVNEQPLPPPPARAPVERGLQRIIGRSLQKDPRDRYASAEEFLADLQSLRQGAPPKARTRDSRRRLLAAAGTAALVALSVLAYLLLHPSAPARLEKSVAVLPFVDMSPDKDQEYFCDGMTEELINRLSNVKDLKVPARTSVFAFKGTTLGIREIGEKLAVESVLEGSVRRSGDRIRITAQLVNVKDAFHLWSHHYDRELKDIFDIQTEVAEQIALALDATITPGDREQIERRATESLDAYNLYLRGRFHWRKRTTADLQEAVRNFESAIRIDSLYALAYVGLADAYVVYPYYRVPGMTQAEAFRRAKRAARQALALEPTLAEAHTSLANVRKEGYWDWAGAEREFLRGIELNPRYATARQWYSENLMVQGRRAEALAEAVRAYELEPSSVVASNNLGLQYLMNRQYPEAIAQLRKAIELDPTHPSPHTNILSAYLMTGRYREAASEIRLWGAPPTLAALLEEACQDTSRWASAANRIEAYALEKREVPSAILVVIFASLGQRDRTFAWLERSYAAHEPGLVYVIRHPLLDRFLPDPRYTAILGKLGLTPL